MFCTVYLCNFVKIFAYYKMGRGFPGDSDGKESACDAGDPGSILGLGRSPGEGNGYLLQFSYLENSIDRGAWWVTVHGVTESWTKLSNLHFHDEKQQKVSCLQKECNQSHNARLYYHEFE